MSIEMVISCQASAVSKCRELDRTPTGRCRESEFPPTEELSAFFGVAFFQGVCYNAFMWNLPRRRSIL